MKDRLADRIIPNEQSVTVELNAQKRVSELLFNGASTAECHVSACVLQIKSTRRRRFKSWRSGAEG